MLTAAVGMTLLTGLAPGGTYFATVAPGAVLSALGMGLTLVPSTIVATQGVPAGQSGLASGLLNTSRLVGGALGLAVLSTVAASSTHGAVNVARGLTDGFGVAFTLGAAFSLAGVAIAVFRLGTQSQQTPEQQATVVGPRATTGQPAFAMEEKAA
jgi:MFS family permease